MKKSRISTESTPTTAPLRTELARRMNQPQRHRLLHGYPMRPLMAAARRQPELDVEPDRPLLIGVLPHPFCNPRIRGCGFCTFPHESYGRAAAGRVTTATVKEIRQTLSAHPSLGNKRVHGLYFGGGTANLTPPDEFEILCSELDAQFDFKDAEVTLEGVPKYFLTHDRALLRTICERLQPRHARISMGVQTFAPVQLDRMGRTAFGKQQEIGEVVEHAHRLGMTASVDLLVNLPAERPGLPHDVLSDIAIADGLGVDQICIYHLVLYEGLGTEWSKQPDLLNALPSKTAAFRNWAIARASLLERGFVQTTLTNFERAGVARSARRFAYERASFQPDVFDGIGFGPGGISTFAGRNFSSAVKTMNHASSDAFVSAIEADAPAVATEFHYAQPDLRLLFITRSLPLLTISRPAYRSLFGAPIEQHFAPEIDALAEAGLVVQDAAELRLTPRGMFFADSVAGPFAAERVRALRSSDRLAVLPEGAAQFHMG